MPGYEQPLARTLDRIQKVSRVSIEDYEDEGEWFLLESETLEDPQLFALLQKQWGLIVGPSADSFALILCQAGRDPGVWLHYLDEADEPDDYCEGCHPIVSW